MDASQLSHLAGLGLSVVAICGPQCPGGPQHFSHPADQSGKIPMRAGWQRSGYRPAAQLAAEHRDGDNAGVLCGLQPGAPLSVIVVDGDDPAAVEWMRQNLPPTPWRVRTRQGEHWYYRAPEGVEMGNRARCGGLRIDVRGQGGQVVAPGSTHRTGHVYEVVGGPWTPQSAALLPVYDPAWLPAARPASGAPGAAPGSPGKATGAAGGAAAWAAPTGGTWPGPRTFSRAEFARAAERVLSYAERLPASVSGSDGHGAAYRAAVAVLRGFPLASWDRMSSMQAEDSLPVDAADAMGEALQILSRVWNPRCTAPDGQTPYPWSEAELRHKVEDAARADRLPGPDYWLYDAPPRRRASENEEPPSVAADEGSEINETDNTHKVAQDMDQVNPLDILSLADAIGGAMRPASGAPARPTTGAPAAAPAPAPAPEPTPEPIPLDEGRLPEWPAGVLRGTIGEYAAALAAATQTPTDMAHITALSVLSAAVRGSLLVRVTPEHEELVTVYTAIAADVSERKSALRRMHRPLEEAQREMVAEAAGPRRAHLADLKALEREIEDTMRATKRPKRGDDAANAQDAQDADDADRAARRSELAHMLADMERDTPNSGRLLTEDTTSEALFKIIAEAGGAIAMLSDEGGDIFRQMEGVYSDKSPLNIYLNAYTGSPITRDRAGTGNVTIDRPCMTIGVLTQPGTLATLHGRALEERGLPARFLYSLPSSLVGTRMITDDRPSVPAELTEAYTETVRRVVTSSERRKTMTLSDGARALFVPYANGIERRLVGDLSGMRGWAGKLAGQVVRIAALLHFADVVAAAMSETPMPIEERRAISADAMARAISTSDYWIAHARAAFGVMAEGQDVAAAKRLLGIIRRKELRTFRARDLHHAMGGRGKVDEVVLPGLQVLLDHGWISREVVAVRRPGNPSPRFVAHPSVFA